MLIDYRELSPVKRSVEVEIPVEALDREVANVTAEFARQARIPGFRQGKVPVKVVRNRFQKDIHEEVVQRLLPRFFQEATTEKSVVAIGNPTLKRVDPLVEGSPIRFEAEFEIKPEFTLQEYHGLEIASGNLEVADTEVDAMVDRLREQASTFRPVEDRGAEDGDYVVIDLESSGEGVEPQKSEAGHVQLGEESPLPELHDALRGHRPGDEVSFEKSYPEDSENEDLRGKTVHYLVHVREIRVRELPEMTEEFVKSMGFESTDEMRSRIRADLEQHRKTEVARSRRQEVGQKLAEMHHFEVPEIMVEEELGASLRNYARFLASQGLDVERAEIDWAKVRDEFHPEAVKRVRRILVLDRIAEQESLTVPDSDVDQEIRSATESSGRDFAEVKHNLRHDGGYENLRTSLLRERALDFVVEQAKPGDS